MTLLLVVLLVALVFEYINGFHDTANSIATVVSTRVLTPRLAIILATATNLFGALFLGTAVAKTVSSGLVDNAYVNSTTIIAAMLAGIIWNLATWWLGLPSSSSHALVGGLCGATLGTAAALHAANPWAALIWAKIKTGAPWYKGEGLFYKVVIPMVSSPVAGLLIGWLVMSTLYIIVRHWRPKTVNGVFGKLQLVSAAYMGLSHGQNDAQKTMGIITLALVAATKAGALHDAPPWLGFLATADGGANQNIPVWVKIVCALVMAAGTAAGGWRIIKTLGKKLVHLQPIHGFAAETTGATVLLAAAHFGMPVSTTHAITTSIMGVGCAKRWNALNLSVVQQIVIAWILTLPATAILGYLFARGFMPAAVGR